MKVLVTSGKGLIGSHLVNYLKARGYWVRNVDIKKDAYLKINEDEFVQGDLTEPQVALSTTKNIDFVYNLARGPHAFYISIGRAILRGQPYYLKGHLAKRAQKEVKKNGKI